MSKVEKFFQKVFGSSHLLCVSAKLLLYNTILNSLQSRHMCAVLIELLLGEKMLLLLYYYHISADCLRKEYSLLKALSMGKDLSVITDSKPVEEKTSPTTL